MHKRLCCRRLQQRLQNLENLSSRSNDREAHFQKIKNASKKRSMALGEKVRKVEAASKKRAAVQAQKREYLENFTIMTGKEEPARIPSPLKRRLSMLKEKHASKFSVFEKCERASANRKAILKAKADKASKSMPAAKKATLPPHLQKRLAEAKAMPRTGVLERCARAEETTAT